jgi:hypothetical protein
MRAWLYSRGHFLQSAWCLYAGFNALWAQHANTRRRSVINRPVAEEIYIFLNMEREMALCYPFNKLARVHLSNITWISQSTILFCGSEYRFAVRRETLFNAKWMPLRVALPSLSSIQTQLVYVNRFLSVFVLWIYNITTVMANEK